MLQLHFGNSRYRACPRSNTGVVNPKLASHTCLTDPRLRSHWVRESQTCYPHLGLQIPGGDHGDDAGGFGGQATPQDHRRQKEYCNRFTNAFASHQPPHPRIQCWGIRRGVRYFLFMFFLRLPVSPGEYIPNIEFGVRGGGCDLNGFVKRLQYFFRLQSRVFFCCNNSIWVSRLGN